jgi:hypothetical protein
MKPKPKPEPEIAEPELSEAELDELFQKEEKDPFDSLPARLAWLFRKFGGEELRQCLFPAGVPPNLQKRLVSRFDQPSAPWVRETEHRFNGVASIRRDKT